jgi:hypothetical protein
MYGLVTADEETSWDEIARGFLERLRNVKEVRGCVVGNHLGRLAVLLEEYATSTSAREDKENQSKTGPQLTAKDWHEIEIAFLSDHQVEILTRGQRKNYNYAELGFEDRRRGNPNLAWATFRQIAEGEGVKKLPPIAKERARDRGKLEKRIQEIRTKLRTFFGIKEDPIPLTGFTYQTSFKIYTKPSYYDEPNPFQDLH